MPARPTLVVERDDGTERARVTCEGAHYNESLIEMWTATAVVDRDVWLADIAGTFDEITDRFRILRGDGTTFFEGRFHNDARDGNTINVVIHSYETDAQDAEPTGGRVIYQNAADSTVASDAIAAVPTLSAGTVETGAASVSFTFANASQSKVLRDAAEPAGQDLRYNFDRTVDFLDRLGSDKSGSITISSTAQDIVNALSVEDQSKDPVTHIRGLGAQHGPDQVLAEAVAPSYNAGERQVWREYENKDIVQQDRLQTIVDRLIAEADANRRRLRVEAGLTPDVDVSLGDTVQVDLDNHGIDTPLRIVRLKEFLSNDARYVATLTNRTPERGGDRKRRDDIGRFNSGDQGFIDRDNFRAVERQPVTSTLNATGEYPYPDDVQTEILSELTVRSIPYRAYSSGAADGGGVATSTGANSVFEEAVFTAGSTGTVTGDGTTKTLDTFSTFTDTQQMNVTISLEVSDTAGSFNVDTVRVTDGVNDYENVVRTAYGSEGRDSNSALITVPVDVGDGTTFTAEIDTSSGVDYLANIIWVGIGDHTHDVFVPDHTHPVEPGVTEFAGQTASGVDVVVDGTTVATNIGSGTFTTTVDLSGVFTPGVNEIELVSDSLGRLSAYVQTQLFRRGRESL